MSAAAEAQELGAAPGGENKSESGEGAATEDNDRSAPSRGENKSENGEGAAAEDNDKSAPSTPPKKAAAGGLRHGEKPKQARQGRQEGLRVSWDEAGIAEHDLERGTRQKIDEPKTPWASPGSDLEDDEEDIGTGVVLGEASALAGAVCPSGDAAAAAGGSVGSGAAGQQQQLDKEAMQTMEADLFAELASVFSDSVDRAAERAAERPPAIAESPSRKRTAGFAFAEGAPEPKPASAAFRAKRSRHYDEFRAVQAFREQAAKSVGGKSDDESNGS